MIKVLHVVGNLNRGGVETWLHRAHPVLRGLGVDSRFLLFRDQPGAYDKDLASSGAKLIELPTRRRFAAHVASLLKELRTSRYDVVHAHVHHFSAVSLAAAATAQVPVRIVHSHSAPPDREHSRPIQSLYSGLAKAVIAKAATHGLAVSDMAAGALFPSNWRTDANFRVLFCGIDTSDFKGPRTTQALLRELKLPPETYLVGHVGRLEHPKNHPFLVDVFARIAHRNRLAHLLLIGEGTRRQSIEDLVDRKGLRQNVTFLGSRDDVPRLLRGLDVFIFPSLFEGLPLAVVEAQAAGARVIMADHLAQETAVYKPLVSRLPLAAGPEAWATAALSGCYDETSHRQALESIELSKLSLTTSTRLLNDFYREALERARNVPVSTRPRR